MKASEYGIRNLKRIIVKLPEWTSEEGDKYENMAAIYNAMIGQFTRYMGHVLKNVGGIYETPKSVEQAGENVYEPTPKAIQMEAVAFLNKQLFETPQWLLDKSILNKINNPIATEAVNNVQTNILNSLLSGQRLNRMVTSANRFGEQNVYTADKMIDDVKKGVWSELTTKKTIDGYRRNLQKAYVEALITIINGGPGAMNQGAPASKNSDALSIARGNLQELKAQIAAAVPGTKDKMSKYHLQDMVLRITKALDTRG